MAVPNPSQAAFIAYSHAEAANVCTVLGLDASPNGQWVPKIAKYIRCNGLTEIRQAASETALTMQKAHSSVGPKFIGDPWAYAVQAANGRWARSRELYVRLGLYEHSLRGKVVGLVGHQLGAGWWAISPPAYMPIVDWQNMRQTNPKIRAHPPTAAVPVPPMRAIADAGEFVSRLTLTELHSIVLSLKGTLFDHVLLDAQGLPFQTSYLVSALSRTVSARNDVMHARAIPKGAYPRISKTLEILLVALEFDVNKTLTNIGSASPL